MTSFDIIAATRLGYLTSWHERGYLMRLAAIPFALKLGCYLLAFGLGFQNDYLRLTLILLPALFAEGWMLSHYTRLIFVGHRWPYRVTGNWDADLPVLRTRARGVMGGTLVYVLVNMAAGLMAGLIMPHVPAPGTDPSEFPALFGALVIPGLVLWVILFRLFWLHIPYAVNLDVLSYVRTMRGVFGSLPVIGVWILCMVPFFLVLQIGGGLAHALFGDAFSPMLIVLIVAADTLQKLVTTAAIAFGYKELVDREKGPRPS